MINFKVLRFKNFLSTGNAFTEIQLDKNRRTLIIGKNGSGKSAMLDALSFVLYSKPFRKINKPQLVNSVNCKELLVEVEFEIGNNEYLVKRGLKPHIFEIYKNGVLINQEASLRDYQEFFERNILKMNHHAFCQVVVLGSATYTPFMNLAAWQRREVVEDLLDIQIFSTMNTLLKDKLTKNKEAQQKSKYDIDLKREMIEMQKRVEQIKHESKADRIATIQNKLDPQIASLASYDQLQPIISAKLDQLEAEVLNHTDQPAKVHRLKDIMARLRDKITVRKSEIEFYTNNDVCSVCHQHIEEDFRQAQIGSLDDQLAELDNNMPKVADAYDAAKKGADHLDRLKREHQKTMTEMTTLQNNRRHVENRIKELQLEIQELQGAEETITADSYENTMNELVERLRASEEVQERLTNEGVVLGYASSLLKDGGIKGQIIKQYIPVMNALINKYLTAMDFYVQFELDEQFNEIIKSRYRDEFSYQSFSEGEKFRMNIAILFAWRALARMRNSASTNLLIMDEVFDSSLDAEGVDEFMKIINELTKDTNLFVISHRGDMMIDKFDSVIRYEKHGNFSRMV